MDSRAMRGVGLALVLAASPTAAAQAISYGGEIAANCYPVPAGASAQNMTVAAPGASVGDTVLVVADATANLGVTSIGDSAGHTYATDVSGTSSFRVLVASSRVTAPLPAGGNIVINWTNGTGLAQSACANAAVFSNLSLAAGYLDASGSAGGTSANPSVMTSATTQQNDLVVGVFATPNVKAFVGPGFSPISAEACIASPVPLCMHAEFKVASAVGTQTADATLASSAPWYALAAAYKGSAPVVSSALKFFTLPPCRILDTRNTAGTLGGPALQPSATRVFPVMQGTCGVPASAQALSVNVTVTDPTAAGWVQLYPSDLTPPVTSNVNFAAGVTRANNALLKLPSDGSGNVSVRNGSSGTVGLIVDVSGWFQ